MRNIKWIVVHCSATPNGKEFHASDIDRWHKDKGWTMIGYHYVICVDGSLEPGRAEDKIGAHVEGHNKESMGICLIGTDGFSAAQYDTLAGLLVEMRERFPDASILGHRDFPEVHKICPGFDVRAWCKDQNIKVWGG